MSRLVFSFAALVLAAPLGAQGISISVTKDSAAKGADSGGVSINMGQSTGMGQSMSFVIGSGTASVSMSSTPATPASPSSDLVPNLPSDPAADAVRIVGVTPKDGNDLSAVLKKQYAIAVAAGRTPFVELASESPKSMDVAKALSSSKTVRDAFAGTYIIVLDTTQWTGKLAPLGFKTDVDPAFFSLDSTGKALGPQINGHAWTSNAPADIAFPLKAFFSAHLKSTKK